MRGMVAATGTWSLLQERFGEEKAAEIITQNPGILTCTAGAVAQQSDDDILKATELAVTVDENKGLVKFAALSSFLAFFPLVGWRIGTRDEYECAVCHPATMVASTSAEALCGARKTSASQEAHLQRAHRPRSRARAGDVEPPLTNSYTPSRRRIRRVVA